jgi:hypothetical protein
MLVYVTQEDINDSLDSALDNEKQLILVNPVEIAFGKAQDMYDDFLVSEFELRIWYKDKLHATLLPLEGVDFMRKWYKSLDSELKPFSFEVKLPHEQHGD